MTAVVALDPQLGDCILDMCAAPGGKTSQIATCLQGKGTVVANEIHAARLPSLRVNLGRLGLTQVLTTQSDGRSLSLPLHSFDRVLVDAPCSGEGNLRRRRPRAWQATHGNRLATAQKRLLHRALDLVKPGGTVVYSTCTFAPEENEAVLDAVVGDRAVVEPFAIAGVNSHPGVTHWQGQDFRSDITNAHRYWPHDNNTGGFFVAKLRRTDAAIASPLANSAESISPLRPADLSLVKPLLERFGLPIQTLSDYQCWATGKRRLWLANADLSAVGNLPPQTVGLPLATLTNLGWKPTTAFLQRFGPQLQQNSVTLPDEFAAQQFLQGRSLNLTAPVEPGYVHVRWGEFELGCGRYRTGCLESQIPKHLRWSSASRRRV
jgi:NOL1/NOP2/sun family putative RNA methylase